MSPNEEALAARSDPVPAIKALQPLPLTLKDER